MRVQKGFAWKETDADYALSNSIQSEFWMGSFDYLDYIDVLEGIRDMNDIYELCEEQFFQEYKYVAASRIMPK